MFPWFFMGLAALCQCLHIWKKSPLPVFMGWLSAGSLARDSGWASWQGLWSGQLAGSVGSLLPWSIGRQVCCQNLWACSSAAGSLGEQTYCWRLQAALLPGPQASYHNLHTGCWESLPLSFVLRGSRCATLVFWVTMASQVPKVKGSPILTLFSLSCTGEFVAKVTSFSVMLCSLGEERCG